MPSKKLNRIPVYFSDEELTALNELAQEWGTSKGGAIKEALKAAIMTNWQKRDTFADYKANRKKQEREDEADTKAAAIGPKPERKRQRQEPTHSDYLGTYEQGQAEAADFFQSKKNNGRTLEEVREDNAVYFEERGEEWRRGFADQFRKLEAEAEQAEALKEAAAIESQTQAAKTEKTEKPETAKTKEATAGQKGKQKAGPNSARAYREAGIKRGAKRNRNRKLLSGEFLDEEAKAEAEAFKEEAAKEAAELKAKTEAINRKIAACHSDYQAGKISAAEHDRRINELNAELDDLPF